MAFGFLLSWVVNVVLWGIIIAIIDEGKQYRLERIPEVPFVLSVGIPTLLELIAFTFENKPFLALIWPWFGTLF